MNKKFLIILIVSLFLILSGCSPRVNEEIKIGISKMHQASIMISQHNIQHCKEKLSDYKKQFDTAKTYEKRALLKAKIDLEIEYLNANGELPKAIDELKKWAYKVPINSENKNE